MKKTAAILMFCAACLFSVMPVQAKEKDPAVLQVGDWQVTISELNEAMAGPLFEFREKLFQLQMRKLQEVLAAHLVELEAKAQETTPEALLGEIAAKAKKVTDDEVKAFITANREQIPEDSPEIHSKIKMFLYSQEIQKAKVDFIAGLVKKYPVQISLPRPVPPRLRVPGPFDLAKGSANAPVTIVEFSDFECPYCRRAQGVINKVMETYGDKVRLVFRHFPLEFHKLAPKASEASLCAADQNRFWEFHDALFAESKWLQEEQLKKLAAKLELDAEKFTACLDSGAKAQRVEQDSEVGRRLGVTGTPTFFINGVLLVGSRPFDDFKELIDKELGTGK